MRNLASLLLLSACSAAEAPADAGNPDASSADPDASLEARDGGGVRDGGATDASTPPPITTCTPNRWVTVDAVGGGDGSMAQPWTLDEAMAMASPGDVVEVGPGVYVAPGTDERNVPAWNLARSGTADAPIVLCARHPAVYAAAERSELRAGGGTGPSPAFGTYTRDHIVWDGFYVNEAASPSRADTGPVVVWDSEDVTITRCLIEGAAVERDDNHNAIRLEAVRDVRILDNRMTGVRGSGTSATSRNHAAIMTYDSSYVRIEHNEVADCQAGLYLKGDREADGHPNGALVVRYNWIHDISLNAIAIVGVVAVDDVLSELSYNLVERAAGGVRFTHVGEDHPAAIHLHHNTFVDTGAGALVPSATTMFDVVLEDNLVVGSPVYYTTWDAAAIALVISHGFGSDSNFGDPAFVFAFSEAGFEVDRAGWEALSGLDGSSSVGDAMLDPSTGHLAATSAARSASSTGGPVGASVTGDEVFGVRSAP